MFHFFDVIQDTGGNSLPGYFVALSNGDGTAAPLFADANGTPILSVSGQADKAKTEAAGNVDFYVADGTYRLQIYAPDAQTLVKTIDNVPMIGDLSDVLTAAQGAATAAQGSAAAASDDAIATAADRVQTGLDKAGTAADVVTANAAVTDAEAARDQAQIATLTSRFYKGARSYVPQGLVLAAITAAGTGGTDGDYIVPLTGGNLTIAAYVAVTVAGGAVTAVSANAPGLYIGNALSIGTVDLSSIAGLTGATVTPTGGYLISSGEYYTTDHATDPLRAALFQNQANAAVEVVADFGPADTALAKAWAESDTAPDPDDPTSKSSKTSAAEAAQHASDASTSLAELNARLITESGVTAGQLVHTTAFDINNEHGFASGGDVGTEITLPDLLTGMAWSTMKAPTGTDHYELTLFARPLQISGSANPNLNGLPGSQAGDVLYGPYSYTPASLGLTVGSSAFAPATMTFPSALPASSFTGCYIGFMLVAKDASGNLLQPGCDAATVSGLTGQRKKGWFANSSGVWSANGISSGPAWKFLGANVFDAAGNESRLETVEGEGSLNSSAISAIQGNLLLDEQSIYDTGVTTFFSAGSEYGWAAGADVGTDILTLPDVITEIINPRAIAPTGTDHFKIGLIARPLMISGAANPNLDGLPGVAGDVTYGPYDIPLAATGLTADGTTFGPATFPLPAPLPKSVFAGCCIIFTMTAYDASSNPLKPGTGGCPTGSETRQRVKGWLQSTAGTWSALSLTSRPAWKLLGADYFDASSNNAAQQDALIYREKMGRTHLGLTRLLTTADTQIILNIAGDSWTAGTMFYPNLLAKLKAKYGDAGGGYFSYSFNTGAPPYTGGLVPPNQITDYGRRVYGSPKPYGVVTTSDYPSIVPLASIDLQGIDLLASGDAFEQDFPASPALSAVALHWIGAGGGQIRYTFNGGSTWTTLTVTGTSGVLTVSNLSLSGYAGGSAGTLRVEWVSGVARIAGCNLKSAAHGIRLNRVACAGADVTQFLAVGSVNWQAQIADLAPTGTMTLEATNSQGINLDPTTWANDWATIIGWSRAAMPTMDQCFTTPPENQRANTVPMSSYSAAARNLAQTVRTTFRDLQSDVGVSGTPAAYADLYIDSLHFDPTKGGHLITAAYLDIINPYRGV